MGIRIECSKEGYTDCWIEYREDRWIFKDRNDILNSVSDLKTLEIILSYVEDWSLRDVNGKDVVLPVKKKRKVSLFDYLDDSLVIPWLIGSWFEARVSRSNLPKETSQASSDT